jgi:hypothetical protein
VLFRSLEPQDLVLTLPLVGGELRQAAAQALDVLRDDVRARCRQGPVGLGDARAQRLQLGGDGQQLRLQLGLALQPLRVGQQGLRGVELALRLGGAAELGGAWFPGACLRA